MPNNIFLYVTQEKKIKLKPYKLSVSVYLSQKRLAKLLLKKPCYDATESSINGHIANKLKGEELQEDLTTGTFQTIAKDNKQYNVKNYFLETLQKIIYKEYAIFN